MEEFERIKTEASAPVESTRTFREDYEFWIDGETVMVSYSGMCDRCGSGVVFKDSRAITIKVPGGTR